MNSLGTNNIGTDRGLWLGELVLLPAEEGRKFLDSERKEIRGLYFGFKTVTAPSSAPPPPEYISFQVSLPLANLPIFSSYFDIFISLFCHQFPLIILRPCFFCNVFSFFSSQLSYPPQDRSGGCFHPGGEGRIFQYPCLLELDWWW
jgi:hypothetical protein